MKSHRLYKSASALAVAGAIALAGSPSQARDEARGLSLAKQADKANEGFKGESSELEMELINARGQSIKRKMKGKTKEVKSDGDKSIVTFLWPADVKGTRMLTWTHKKGNDDQWLFLPAINRVKRISARNKSGSFMGSEFAYEDLASQEVEKFKWAYLADEPVDGRKTWKIERIPVDKRSGYSKQVTWLDQEYLNPLKVEYYDRKNKLLKTATFKYSKYDKWYRPDSIHMVNHQTRKKSVISWKNRKLGQSFSDEDFSSEALAD